MDEQKNNNDINLLAKEYADQAVREARKSRGENGRNALTKLMILFSLAVLAFAVFIFATIAWFTMSREVGTGGMSMATVSPNFEINMLPEFGSGVAYGKWQDLHNLVHDDSALYWKMTPSNNLYNYEPDIDETHLGDQGIKPGSWGVISFYVNPKVDSINLDFSFEIIGYQMVVDDKGTTSTDDDTQTLTALSDLTDHSGDVAQTILNGHILLFENRTVTGSGSNAVITYSDPILSNAQMHRVFNRTITKDDTASQRIDIYWVWPNTLSTLVDARSHTGVTTAPLCSVPSSSYSAITANIVAYPHYYLKGVAPSGTVSVSDMVTHYDTYGDMYDQGDNEIGMRVNYVLIRLSISEGTTGGSGS